MLLFVIGGLAVLGGLCIGVAVWIVPLDQAIVQLRNSLSAEQLAQLPPGWTLEQIIRIAYTALGVASVGAGVLLLCLAPFIRRGSRAPTITAIVLFALMGMFCLLNLLSILIQLVSGPSATTILALLMDLVMSAIVVTALILLVQAMRATRRVAWHGQMQAQYMQYAHAAGMPAGAPPVGYGYGTSVGVPPPPPRSTESGESREQQG